LKAKKHNKGAVKRSQTSRGSSPLPAMTLKALLAQVNRIAEPVCETEGLELVHVEYQKEPAGKILRLYIDKPGGVTIDDCAAVSRQVGDLLDIYIQGDEPYSLEISSPGENRPIGKPEDFNRFKGHRVRIRSSQAINGQKNFTGTLMGMDAQNVNLMIDEKIVGIDIEQITKARLINSIGES
jgi:ribosome maturation factor RimP